MRIGAVLKPLGLLAAVAGVAWLDWTIYKSPLDTTQPKLSPGSGATETPVLPEAAVAPAARSIQAFPQMVMRPLFHPDRKPIVPNKPPVAEVASLPPPSPPGELQLVGLMRAGGNGYRALIRNSSDLPAVWFVEGDQIRGWKLQSVTSDGVELIVANAAPGRPAAGRYVLRFIVNIASETR